MGNRMTDQTMIATNQAQRIDCGPFDVAPPNAPLPMPKQVIEQADGVISRAISSWLSVFNMLKHSIRRAG